jgi:hypothetical protein
MILGICIIAPEPISTAYFVNASHQSVCLCCGNEYTRNNRIIGRVIFCAVRVVSKESLWVRLCIPLLLLVNGWVNTFLRHRGNVGGVVYYTVHVVSKEVGD